MTRLPPLTAADEQARRASADDVGGTHAGRHGAVEVGVVGVEQRPAGRARRDHDGAVEPAVHAHRFAEERLDVAAASEVGDQAVGRHAVLLQLALGARDGVVVGRREHDAGTGGSKSMGTGEPDAVVRVRDQEGGVSEAHRAPPGGSPRRTHGRAPGTSAAVYQRLARANAGPGAAMVG